VILDSSLLIASELDTGRLEKLFTVDAEAKISAITVTEYLRGVSVATTDSQRKRRQEFYDQIVAHIPVVPYDAEIAEVGARIWSELKQQGQRMSDHDIIVAATALSRRVRLVTLELRSFPLVKDLKILY